MCACACVCLCACVCVRVCLCACVQGSHLTAWKSTSIDFAQFSKAEAYHENQFASDVMHRVDFFASCLKNPYFM